MTATFAIAPTIRHECKQDVILPFPFPFEFSSALYPTPFRRDGSSATLSCDSAGQESKEWRTCQRWLNMPVGFQQILPQQQAALKWRIRNVVEEEISRVGLRSLQLEVVQVIPWDTYVPK